MKQDFKAAGARPAPLRKKSVVDRVNGAARKLPAWAVYIVGLLPVPWMFYLAQTGGYGPDPVKGLEHALGQWALQLLIAGLAITPLRRFAGINLIKFRRALGLLAFAYVSLHLTVWIALDMGLFWAQMLGDVIKRPYITIGMTGFLCLIPLALTSNNRSIRKLGPKWRSLHKLVYLAVLLGGIHFIWLVKGVQLEPLIYMAVILALLAVRLPHFAKVRA
ncbi:sulfoxide reductase heme-binding subunit YedZ [Sulfitobacter brevis]|uniref:Protein-methionine-sulfoxide reductase heme-binding subunit MsrQ n=1 Tax=Sulfitobacter brevis TaxID=74348 RepID=A0A1I1VJP1_9RHOB|nr:protein-methionine-sulfoxide reductase heme-binding subunit MsrQ [Sulfitobacter brevis]SFD83111.1 sulfoxide reductase heme-binding subunit YedZ [Sulfitobacter brevis]